MKKNISLIFAILLLNVGTISGQNTIEILQKGVNNSSLRGLSVVSDQVFWVSGANGSVGRTINGGKTIDWLKVKGFEKADFRDIEAFDENTAIIMAIAEPTYILKTIDAGKNWKIVYENRQKGMFLDAMDFTNKNNGIVVGDAVNGKIFLAKTSDNGGTWQEMANQPDANQNEGCFASSGTNIVYKKKDVFFVTGGKYSRIFKNGKAKQIPIIQGVESTGANSIAVSKNGMNIIIVGGDFSKKNDTTANCIMSKNAGKSFRNSISNPLGYRSCVEFLSKSTAIACGLNGVDITTDRGLNWLNVSKENFHVCQKSKSGNEVYLAGANGQIGKLIFSKPNH